MLASFLNQIPAAFSRRFLLGTFLPLTLFSLSCLLLGDTCLTWVQSWVDRYSKLPTLPQTALSVMAVISLAAIGLVLSGLRSLARDALENASLPLTKREKAARLAALEQLKQAVQTARSAHLSARQLAGRAPAQLSAARAAGSIPANQTCDYPEEGNAAHEQVGAATGSRDVARLNAAVAALEAALRQNNADLNNNTDSARLDKDQVGLVESIENLLVWRSTELGRAILELQTRFPGERIYGSPYQEVTGALSSYTEQRYGAEYLILWPRLEAVLRKENSEVVAALEEAGTQIDFVIAMFWLTGLFTALSIALLGVFSLNPWLLLGIGVLGPLLMWAWYELGARSYRAFGDQVRTAVDIGRLKVFDAVGLARPESSRDERAFWEKLNSVLAFGGLHNLPYASQKPAPAPQPEQHIQVTLTRAPPGAGAAGA